VARRVTSARWALLCAGLYAFSPGVILDGTLWAQSDGMQGLILLLATLFALQRRPGWTGMMIGLGFVFKLFPILYAPLLLIYLLRTGGRRFVAWFVGAGSLTTLLFCLPFMIPPHSQVFPMMKNIMAVFGTAPWASVSAYNLW
jgi:uncharacterized membrane protein